jgi:hypothetical protein
MSRDNNQDSCYEDEDQNQEEEYEDLNGYSPERIAQAIFSKKPEPPLTQQLMLDPTQADIDPSYIVEILMTVLLEGLDIFTGGLKEADLSNFNSQLITAMNPWFNSLGFNIKVATVDQEDKDLYEEFYCRAVLNRGSTQALFTINNVEDRSYHFLLNGTYLEMNRAKTNVSDLYGVFTEQDKAYLISFDFFIPPTDNSMNKLL